ncbi:MAG: hypothetical protein A2381_19465 [Bdellovibrionales bacterium RIFOXYB1_FULL_37_110]|nr:MAG: hypothetical protein A2417_10965 [Bdellovibrionales bacterium RIFOXYC1_FULL_37_79]OFZ60659.1 MAG: hypothetical protein A2381_19465 [Bdellovibrionales bacterium RIFOXYB1_FULL_37_110]OFZ64411.1 MAG: hypothetical protein A2577_10115 [Bdellovibrionales bacterium RIFOXYD1_FULL_36_51]
MKKIVFVGLFFINSVFAICSYSEKGMAGRILEQGSTVIVTADELIATVQTLEEDDVINITKIKENDRYYDGQPIKQRYPSRFKVYGENISKKIVIEKPCPPSG